MLLVVIFWIRVKAEVAIIDQQEFIFIFRTGIGSPFTAFLEGTLVMTVRIATAFLHVSFFAVNMFSHFCNITEIRAPHRPSGRE